MSQKDSSWSTGESLADWKSRLQPMPLYFPTSNRASQFLWEDAHSDVEENISGSRTFQKICLRGDFHTSLYGDLGKDISGTADDWPWENWLNCCVSVFLKHSCKVGLGSPMPHQDSWILAAGCWATLLLNQVIQWHFWPYFSFTHIE